MAEACYQKRFYTASFKGSQFEAEEASSEHGRRGAEGQFPFAEHTAYADMGRAIRTYHIKGRFAQNDHIARSRRFIAVCESPGPGTLVHPTRGAVRVACKKLKVSDRIIEGYGVTELDLEFVEAASWLGRATGLSIGGLSAVRVIAAVANTFFRAYDVGFLLAGQAMTVVDYARVTVGEIKSSFDRVAGLSTDPDVWRISQDLATVARSDMARSPTVALEAIANGIDAVERYGRTPQARLDGLRGIANVAAKLPVSGSAALTPLDAIVVATRVHVGVALARASLSAAAETAQDAARQYGMILTVLRQEADAARLRCDDELHLALVDYITQAQTALLERIYGTPPVIEYDFAGGVSTLVAAHEIYRDARRAHEIEARNPSAFPWALGPTVAALAADRPVI